MVQTKGLTMAYVKRNRQLPIVLKEYKSLPVDTIQDFRVRIVTYNNNPQPLLDIREFVVDMPFTQRDGSTKMYTGYIHKGITVNIDAVEYLTQVLPDILRRMKDEREKIQGKEIQRKTEETSQSGRENQSSLSSEKEMGSTDTNSGTVEDIQE